MMDSRWKEIEYLLEGNIKQRKAYSVLKTIDIFDILKKYQPLLVGTIPIDIDLPNSDLDIICEVNEFSEFKNIVTRSFSEYDNFEIDIEKSNKKQYILSKFRVMDFEIEIYGEPLPVYKQNAYRHMIVEEKILKLGGEKVRKEIIDLKRQGLKTEPAFFKYLNLKGDPYDELLKLERVSNEYLKDIVQASTNRI